MAKYKVFIKRSASKELEAVAQKTDAQRIVARIHALAGDRAPGCEKLAGYEDRYRVRQGDSRVAYAVDAELSIPIFKVGHRREVYR